MYCILYVQIVTSVARKELNVNRSPSMTMSGMGWTDDQNVKSFPAIMPTRYL